MNTIHYVANLSLLRGLERQAILQCKFLIKHGINCELWTLTSDRKYCKYNDGLKVITLVPKNIPGKEFLSFFSIFFLLTTRTSFARNADLIHLHGFSKSCLPFILFAKILRKKIVVKISNSGDKSVIKKMQKSGLFSKFVLSVGFKFIDQWICLNNTCVHELNGTTIARQQIVLIPNMCASYKLSEIQPRIVDNEILNVVFSGAMQQHKNPIFALNVARLMQNNKSIQFHFTGDGPLLTRMKKTGSSNTTFYGKLDQSQLFELYKKSHVYISSSIAEGMSNSLLEAISFGLIPMVTDIEANSFVLGTSYPHLLKLDLSEFVTTLNFIRNNGRTEFDREYILERFSPQSVCLQIVQMYEKLLST